MVDGYVAKSWWKRNRAKALGITLALLLVISAIVVGQWWSQRCAAGIVKVGETGECVGVATDLFVFDPAYEAVQKKIDSENARVDETGKPFVTIVYVAPMTLDDEKDTITEKATNNALEGAYLAQKRANAGNPDTVVRLLLANPGSQSEHAGRVVDRLKSIRREEHVVAVAGLGQSNSGAREAIDELSTSPDRIPMFGATITADGFTDDVAGGRSWFVRIAPSNREQIGAVFDELGVQNAVLIRDDNQADPFARNISKAFVEEYQNRQGQIHSPQKYDSSLGSQNFSSTARNICVSGADTVIFAGRYGELEELLANLKDRPCRSDLKVVTLDSVASISGVEEIKKNLSDNLSLYYTQLATPRAWEARPDLFAKAAVDDFRKRLRDEFRRPAGDDESAIMAYDAVTVAVEGVRMAREEVPPGEVEAEDVFSRVYSMNEGSVVGGASGWISLDDKGNPQRKPLAILRLTANDEEAELYDVVSSPSPVFTYGN